MSLAYILGLCVGFLVVAVICIVFRKRRCNNKYDERQKAVQGVAYKIGFISLCAYLLLNGFICMEIGNWLPVFDMNFIGVCFGIVCYAGYAIFNDAYISINSRPVSFLVFLAVIAGINYLCYFTNNTLDNEPEVYLTNLICAFLLTAVCIMLIIKVIIDKCNEKKELVEE